MTMDDKAKLYKIGFRCLFGLWCVACLIGAIIDFSKGQPLSGIISVFFLIGVFNTIATWIFSLIPICLLYLCSFFFKFKYESKDALLWIYVPIMGVFPGSSLFRGLNYVENHAPVNWILIVVIEVVATAVFLLNRERVENQEAFSVKCRYVAMLVALIVSIAIPPWLPSFH